MNISEDRGVIVVVFLRVATVVILLLVLCLKEVGGYQVVSWVENNPLAESTTFNWCLLGTTIDTYYFFIPASASICFKNIISPCGWSFDLSRNSNSWKGLVTEPTKGNMWMFIHRITQGSPPESIFLSVTIDNRFPSIESQYAAVKYNGKDYTTVYGWPVFAPSEVPELPSILALPFGFALAIARKVRL